jgi:hypothetical protein
LDLNGEHFYTGIPGNIASGWEDTIGTWDLSIVYSGSAPRKRWAIEGQTGI